MNQNKEAALQLRLKGYSYNEITKIFDVSKSTLSSWFANLELSKRAQRRINKKIAVGTLKGLLKHNKNQTHLAMQRMRRIRAKSQKEVTKFNLNELKLIGAALYWAEGYKRLLVRNGRKLTHHPVALTNSDPRLIAIFLRFLREVCQVDNNNIKADIRIYQHQNEKRLLQFWSKITNLPQKNFGKVYYGISKSSLGKRPYNILPYGTLLIRVNNTNLFHTIMGWVEGLANLSQPNPTVDQRKKI